MKIESKKVVSLTYTLVVDGAVKDQTTKEKPLEFIFGMGYLLPKFEENIEGKIVVAVIVSAKGKVIDSGVVRSVSHELDEEALRVAKMLKFKPAVRGKKKVKARVDISFPIRHGQLSYFAFSTIDV